VKWTRRGRFRLPQQLLERSPPPVWRDMRPCAHTALQDAEGDVAVSDLNDLAVAREEGGIVVQGPL
jgi:hypothetical protein